ARALCRGGVAGFPTASAWVRFAPRGRATTAPAVIVARLAAEKDVGTLLAAASIVAQRHSDFRLLIAGDGPCRAELEARASQLRLHEVVQFLREVRDVATLLTL